MPVDKNTKIIEVKDVSFNFGKNEVLKNINLEIYKGDYIGIVGPNGGGKTTLIKLMLGLLKPNTGEISLFGSELSKFNGWSSIAYVPQKATNFDPKFPLTVKEAVMMGRYPHRGMFRSLKKEDLTTVDWALEQVEMLELKDRLIGNLSGGQQQRVFMARALAQKPEVIFLDEPTTGVDSNSQIQFYKLLEKLNKELGITLVLISHDINMVMKEVTEVICVNQILVCNVSPDEFVKGDYLTKMFGEQMKFILHNHQH